MYAMQSCPYELTRKNASYEVRERAFAKLLTKSANPFPRVCPQERALRNLRTCPCEPALNILPLRQAGSFAQQRIARRQRFRFNFIALHALDAFIVQGSGSSSGSEFISA